MSWYIREYFVYRGGLRCGFLQQSTLEAQNLTNQMYLYYASNKPDLYALVREFNYNPQQFDYKLIIEQLHNHQL